MNVALSRITRKLFVAISGHFFFFYLNLPSEEEDMTDKTTAAGSGKPDKMETERDPSISYKDYDVESYLANYSGHTKIARALFIAERYKELETPALHLAIDELKKTPNTQLYKEILEKVGDKLGPTYAKDQGWIDSVDKKAQQQVERLELELNGYKTNLVKESIRVSNCTFFLKG